MTHLDVAPAQSPIVRPAPARSDKWKSKRRKLALQHTVLYIVLTVALAFTLLPFV